MMHKWIFLKRILKYTLKLNIKTAPTFISVINQLDTQNFCFTVSLFHASTCFEHMCSKHVEEWNKLTVKQKFCASSRLVTEINVGAVLILTFWRRNYFFLILAHPVYKMWITQETNKLELLNKLHFEGKKRRVYTMFKIFGTYICWINI